MSPRKWSGLTLLLILTSLLFTACEKSQTDYFPLSGYEQWKYQTSYKKLDKTFHQNYIVANVGETVIDDKKVFVRKAVSGTKDYYQRSDKGIERIALQTEGQLQPQVDEQAVTILPFPLEVGNQWQSSSAIRVIESKTFTMRDRLYLQQPVVMLDYSIESLTDSVKVPAGTYHNCLRVHGSGTTRVKVNRGNGEAMIVVESTHWYAPNVGLVKSVRTESSSSVFLKEGRYEMALEMFTP